jgi:hypothetical protein
VNSFWPHVIGLNEYIARTQSILQGGNADNDVLVYWPIYDVWDDAGRLDKQVSIHNIDEWLHPTSFYKLSKELLKDGYLIDFATDDMIEAMFLDDDMIQADPQGGKYKTLIIPASQFMSLETLNILINLASQGATIIFEDLPKDVPGFQDLENRRDTFKNALEAINFKDGLAMVGNGRIYLSENVSEILTGLKIHGETLVETGLKFARRVIDGDRYYYLVNHTPNSVDQELILNTNALGVMLMDPDHEDVGYVIPQKEDGKAMVRVQLDPGQSIIIRCTDRDVSQIPAWKYVSKSKETLALDGNWKLSFTSGGPELPDDAELSELTSWTNLEDEEAANFSGAGVYEYTLNLEGELADEYILNLGKVAESARVWINGQEVDVLWSIPFKVRAGAYLKPGESNIKVEVANLMGNRIRYMDQHGLEWRKFHEINFVNIDYEPFDASGWEPMPSGLLGPVVLEAVAFE